jgi:hypothetical protein
MPVMASDICRLLIVLEYGIKRPRCSMLVTERLFGTGEDASILGVKHVIQAAWFR